MNTAWSQVHPTSSSQRPRHTDTRDQALAPSNFQVLCFFRRHRKACWQSASDFCFSCTHRAQNPWILFLYFQENTFALSHTDSSLEETPGSQGFDSPRIPSVGPSGRGNLSLLQPPLSTCIFEFLIQTTQAQLFRFPCTSPSHWDLWEGKRMRTVYSSNPCISSTL